MKPMMVYFDETRHWSDDDWLKLWYYLGIKSPWRVDQDELILCDLGISHWFSSFEVLLISAWRKSYPERNFWP
jgi:hypothetical protein